MPAEAVAAGAGEDEAGGVGYDDANGKYILSTDDDVVVDPGWLKAYVEGFRRCPEAALSAAARFGLEPYLQRWCEQPS